MNGRLPRLLLTVFAAAVVVVVVLRDLDSPQPGPLSASHAPLDALRGADHCAACHGDDGQAMTQACETCHGTIAADRGDQHGLHGGLDPDLAADCARCHSEHLGASVQVIGERSFLLAGVPDESVFDHGLLGQPLQGRHADLDCEDCHLQIHAARLEADQLRYGGLSSDCASCHEDVHQGAMAWSCSRCHDQRSPFDSAAAFEHGPSFALDGAHSGARCADCHPALGLHSVATLTQRDEPLPARGCGSCHDSPHRQGFITAVAEQLELIGTRTCARCHDDSRDDWSCSVGNPGEGRMDPALHTATGFALNAPHDRSDCVDCHGEGLWRMGASFLSHAPGRDSGDCAACHVDPHGGQFDDLPGGRGECLFCHDSRSFRPSLVDPARHDEFTFPLADSHRAVACLACHLPLSPSQGEDAQHRYRATPHSCAACHADVHRGSFSGSLDAAVDCAACHDATRFANVLPGAFDHGLDAGFVLDGAHRSARCESCHVPLAEADDAGRRFGRVPDSQGLSAGACANCHEDVHEGRWADRSDVNVGVDGKDCARCHLTSSFAAVIPGSFDHLAATGFALDGAHARAECQACHVPLLRADSSGRTFGVIDSGPGRSPESCESCHQDAHLGGFDRSVGPRVVGGSRGCARCHDSESFDDVDRDGFDHGLWTGIPLTGDHADVACDACHPKLERADSLGRTTLLAAGRACVDCHEDPHVGQFADHGVSDCSRCHDASGSLDFDHDRDSRFPIDSRHSELSCDACHRPWPVPGGGQAVRYRPLGLSCADCHGPLPGAEGSPR